MPTAFQALLKDDGSGGGGLAREHELCAPLSYDSSDETTEVVVLVKNEASDELSAEKPSDVSKPSDLSLLDEKMPSDGSNNCSATPMMDKSASKTMPEKTLALGLTGKNLSGNNSEGKAKENASPQKGSNAGTSLIPLGCTKAALLASGGESAGQCGMKSASACANVNNDLPATTTKLARSDNASDNGPVKKRSKKRECTANECSAVGCTNIARSGGVCFRHGAKANVKRCNWEGCTNYVQKGGVCIRHGAQRKRCNEEGCTNQSVKGGVCKRHGAQYTQKRCNWLGCTNEAKKGGVCRRHGSQVKRCSFEGCTNQAKRGGVCWRHGAKDLAQKAQKRRV